MKNVHLKFLTVASICIFFFSSISYAQPGPKVLVVNAHPDDETSFPIILYKITHDLKGTVDLALITDGQGGFNGSELGSEYYGYNLTDSVVGRSELPRIRKKELMLAGDIMGIRQYYFFDQRDDYYHLDPMPYVSGLRWDVPFIEKKLDQILAAGQYDYIITMLPYAGQHGHHKTAVIMALRALQRYKGEKRPVIIAGSTYKDETPDAYTVLEGFPETAVKKKAPSYYLDVATHFGHGKQVSYKTVAQWVIACYKSQGDMQENPLYKGDKETFRLFDINDDTAIQKTSQLFEQLRKSGYSAQQ
ncbi:PIG-L family deacetylase [Flavihumibacter profundi]|uniref:PIG-L family deacetylase n=1 Tax=Flavihumibacter profundi TaxID=2716883 RepID=UPI001CC495E8|nr:PIG-L family deacetylase [Flavihumibacter profundi]MBZ5856332.1 PIG-L family deacetylase [Flavihumibacter profundi]